MSAPDPYGRTTHDGRLIDNATDVFLRSIEEEHDIELTLFQGIGSAAASANTHVKGRCADLDDDGVEVYLPIIKRKGAAAFHRRYRAGVWPAHTHLCLIFGTMFNPKGIAAEALNQIREYAADPPGDGLAGDYSDPDPWRPDPIPVYTLEDYRKDWAALTRPEPTNVQRARKRIRYAIADLKVAEARLDDVDPSRIVAANQLEIVRGEIRDLREVLDRLPRR